jgi:hypothetical protein
VFYRPNRAHIEVLPPVYKNVVKGRGLCAAFENLPSTQGRFPGFILKPWLPKTLTMKASALVPCSRIPDVFHVRKYKHPHEQERAPPSRSLSVLKYSLLLLAKRDMPEASS